MARIELETLVTSIGLELQKQFPAEEFLEVELYAVVQALFTSLHWAIIGKALDTPDFLQREIITDLETGDHFACAWLSRPEIVDRIVCTSGLNEETSDHALRTIEALIDKRLSEGERFVDVDEIGRIEAPNPPCYAIDLAAHLIVKPSYLAAPIRAASE